MRMSPDEMRVRFEELTPAQQVAFLGKLSAGMELMATVSATMQNAIVTLYPTFEQMAKTGAELENMLRGVTPKGDALIGGEEEGNTGAEETTGG